MAYVFTENMKRGMSVCERLDYGMVGLNRGLYQTLLPLLVEANSRVLAAKVDMKACMSLWKHSIFLQVGSTKVQ